MEEALGGGRGLVVAEGLHLEWAAEEREICFCRIPLQSIFWSGTSPSWFKGGLAPVPPGSGAAVLHSLGPDA